MKKLPSLSPTKSPSGAKSSSPLRMISKSETVKRQDSPPTESDSSPDAGFLLGSDVLASASVGFGNTWTPTVRGNPFANVQLVDPTAGTPDKIGTTVFDGTRTWGNILKDNGEQDWVPFTQKSKPCKNCKTGQKKCGKHNDSIHQKFKQFLVRRNAVY